MMEDVSVDMLFSLSSCHIPRSRSDHYYGTLDDTLYFEERLEKRWSMDGSDEYQLALTLT